MEGFTYTNIFETKALEYLIIVFFFALLVPFWMILNKKNKPAVKLKSAPGFITADSLKLPQGIFFSRFHTWTYLEKTGEAKVGLDDMLLHLTGEVAIEHFREAGEETRRGEALARIHYNGNSLQIISPVSGKICKVNEMVSENPGLVKDDPYRQGWIYTLKPDNWKADTDSCYLADDAIQWAKEELVRVKDFLAVSSMKMMQEPAGIVMQDGGELVEQALTRFPQEVWQEFQEKFLS